MSEEQLSNLSKIHFFLSFSAWYWLNTCPNKSINTRLKTFMFHVKLLQLIDHCVAIVAQWSYIDNSGQVNFSKILCTTTRSGCHDGKCSPTLPRAHSLPLSLMNHTSQQQQFVAWVSHLMLVDQSEADTEIAREMSWHHHRYKSSTNTTMVQFSPAMLPDSGVSKSLFDSFRSLLL